MADVLAYFEHDPDRDKFKCMVKRENQPVFQEDDDGVSYEICGVEISGPSKNLDGLNSGTRISNLKKHLRTKHPDIYEVIFKICLKSI